MNINAINSYNVQNIQAANPSINKSLYNTNPVDTISFNGNTQFQHADSWYLKDETILAQDAFSTTIEDKTVKRSLFDMILKKSYPKKIYDLPLRFREELQSQQTDMVVLNAPSDVLAATGLTNEEFVKAIDKVNALIALVHPRYDLFEDKTKQDFQVQIGNSVANVARQKQGLSGVIYKIEIEGCKPLALKHYINPAKINLKEGAFPEIAIAKKMNEDNVSDIPLLYCANPYDGWMLSEFIDDDYVKREGGISFVDYMIKNNLALDDENSGLTVSSKTDMIFVDFGYIASNASHTYISGFDTVVFDDIRQKANSNDYIHSKQSSLLGVIENVSLYGDLDAKRALLNAYRDKPELKLFGTMLKALNCVHSNQEIPEKIKTDLQEAYEKSGFIGDAAELAKSCNQ